MLNELQKARIRKENKKLHIQRMTDYFMDLAGIYDEVDISANLLAEDIVNKKIAAGQLDELNRLKVA